MLPSLKNEYRSNITMKIIKGYVMVNRTVGAGGQLKKGRVIERKLEVRKSLGKL